ncbi:MAG: Holliday junction branch migration protein RuvA [Clostridiales bacterium]|jgi:Holliday junction DNA helicase RuvA|nr:Holliday junction branch migration protein RuvA [Clostridiales bacterium]
MYSYIKGKITDKESDRLIVDNNGIGYEILVSNNMLALLNAGDDALVYTYFHVKQDGVAILGFQSKEEKTMFLRLITVSGIGPKGALAILNEINPYDLAYAIARNDSARLSSVKGIGKKTAARIILELKEKIELSEGLEAVSKDNIKEEMSRDVDDAAVALQALGFSKNDSVKAAAKAAESVSGAENIIKTALKIIRR